MTKSTNLVKKFEIKIRSLIYSIKRTNEEVEQPTVVGTPSTNIAFSLWSVKFT